MIMRFVVEPEALKEIVDSGQWAVFLGNLEQFWPSHGVLILPSDADRIWRESGLDANRLAEWRKFILRDMYRKTLLGRNSAGIEWNRVESWKSLEDYNGQFDLALLQETRAAYFDLYGDDRFCAHDPQGETPVEITRGYHILYSCGFKAVQDLANKSVPRHESPDQVWEIRFRPHAMHSTSVAVIDRFAVREGRQGLRVFLRKIATEGWQYEKVPQIVEVYSSYKDFRGSGIDTAAHIKSALEGFGQQLLEDLDSNLPDIRITIKLMAERDMKHDRWIRFDHNIFELSNGLAVLESGRSEALGFSVNKQDSERADEESRLRALSRQRAPDNTEFFSVLSQPPRRT